MKVSFLDTNIFLRHVLGDVVDQSARATAYLVGVEGGSFQARTSETVVFEAVFILQRQHRWLRGNIRDALLPLFQLDGLTLPGKQWLSEVFDLYIEKNISFADAYHAVLMRQLGISEIITFDRDFDKIPWVERLEPERQEP